ncbi:MAG: protein kinase [Kofleriaceae bacterium]|nr:protein kinase [Kofleriaceae bacterium]
MTADPLLGTTIERYRLERVLGEGGMGRVYLAVQPAIGSRVAIKVLSEECSRNAELLERFFAEARAVNLIRHENIVSVLDLAQLPDGRPFIIMEFIEGHTLGHHVRKTAAPLGGVAQVIGEVLAGLAAAHAIGIVHRDLKPDNVLVTVEGHAKILDFGIAKLAPAHRADVSPRTKTGALLGTPAYMAPEQISGAGNVDARTDIYSMGIVLYEAVTGTVPFSGGTLFDLMRAHLEEAPPPPRARRPDLPPAMEQVILQALAKDPAHRFQSVTAMAQALAHAASALPAEQWRPLSTRGGPRISASGIGPPTTEKQATPGAFRSTAVAPKTEKDPPRRRGIIVGMIAAASIGVGVTALVLSSRSDSPKQDVRIAEVEQPAVPPAEPTVVAVDAAVLIEPTPSPPPTPAEPSRKRAPVTAAEAPGKPETPAKTADLPAKTAPTKMPELPAAPAKAPTTITRPADYDAKHFDPVAYLPKALALAQQLAPDARLTNFEFDPVFPDGRVDLTMEGRDREYNFRSPSRSARPDGVPRNMPVERPCMIHVEVGAREVTATVRTTEDCDDKLVRHPRCHFAGVWKQALASGTPKDVVARIGWLFDEQWFFDVDLEGKGGGVSTLPDRCP